MTIKELNDKHFSIASGKGWENNPFEDEHTELSIQFAIEVLKSLDDNVNGRDVYTCIGDKIQELKQYLDGN